MAEDLGELQYTTIGLYEPPRRPDKRELCSSPRYRVTVHHPAYESTRLFEISAFDGEFGGIHHGTLLLFCGIIAGGVWNGWLSEEKDGMRLTATVEAVLTKSDYYYHLPNPTSDLRTSSSPYKWPVVLSLDHLTFPHGRPPPGWTFDDSETTVSSSFFSSASVSSMSQAVRDRDMTCRVTRWADGMERAHLCPRSVANWFTREELEQYNISANLSGATSVDDMANAVALRQDVHSELDKGTFVFVRKQGKWVPHFLSPTHNLGPEYHNVPIDMPSAVSEAFVFANVAIAILPRISNFLIRGEKRKVIVKREADTPHIVEMAGTEIQSMLDQSKRQRSKSPRKRPRDPGQDVEPRDAPDEKRLRSSQDHAESREILPTPALTTSTASSDSAFSVSCESDANFMYNKIELLRRQELKKQRRSNKAIACCDYDTADAAINQGLDGQATYSGAHVCFRCLGFDTVEDIPDE